MFSDPGTGIIGFDLKINVVSRYVCVRNPVMDRDRIQIDFWTPVPTNKNQSMLEFCWMYCGMYVEVVFLRILDDEWKLNEKKRNALKVVY